jgi:hypothetical protein
MPRKFVDTTQFCSKKMEKDGNSNEGYWLNKTIDERLAAAIEMIKVAYQEPDYLTKKVDRTIFSSRKHANR